MGAVPGSVAHPNSTPNEFRSGSDVPQCVSLRCSGSGSRSLLELQKWEGDMLFDVTFWLFSTYKWKNLMLTCLVQSSSPAMEPVFEHGFVRV